jgi:hypothetical protein
MLSKPCQVHLPDVLLLLCCWVLQLQVQHAAKYDGSEKKVRALIEDAREAHWKLTADKGFNTLRVGD